MNKAYVPHLETIGEDNRGETNHYCGVGACVRNGSESKGKTIMIESRDREQNVWFRIVPVSSAWSTRCSKVRRRTTAIGKQYYIG